VIFVNRDDNERNFTILPFNKKFAAQYFFLS